MQCIDVALVGRERQGDENLALRYLAASLARAGHRPHIVPLHGPWSFAEARSRITKLDATLVGLSIPDGDIAIDSLAFARYLRTGGYTGHIVCGGPLATLVRNEILERHEEIDSVIRQEGETPIAMLASRIAAGESLEGIPGMTTRQGDGAPAIVDDPAGSELRPLREEALPAIQGIPVARMLASRGCPGRCRYCAPAALQQEALEEGIRAGTEREVLRKLGVGGLRRRAPLDVAGEMAELYLDRGARLFVLVDDNLLGGSQEDALRWLLSLRRHMHEHGIGHVALSMSMDPTDVSDEVLDLLLEMGLIRTLAGVESLTPGGLSSLGRRPRHERSIEVISRLRREGVIAAFNSLLVHPESTQESISAEIEALGPFVDMHLDTLSVSVHSGTRMWREMWHSGGLSGGYLSWRYECADPVAARFRALMIRLRIQGMGSYGVSVQAHDLALSLTLARHFGIGTHSRSMEQRVTQITADMNRHRLDSMAAALDLAATDMRVDERREAADWLVASFTKNMDAIGRKLQRIEERLEKSRESSGPRSNMFYRSSVTSTFVLCGTLAAGCYQVHQRTDADAVEVVDGPVDSTDAGCTDEEFTEEVLRVRELSGHCYCDEWEQYTLVIDDDGRILDVVTWSGDPIPSDIKACYMDALAGETFPCLGEHETYTLCYICLV